MKGITTRKILHVFNTDAIFIIFVLQLFESVDVEPEDMES